MNNDLISRKALKKAFKNHPLCNDVWLHYSREIIDNAPTVEQKYYERVIAQINPVIEARPQGKWEYNQYDGNPNIGNWHCSICHNICYEIKLAHDNYNFCPWCGADMRKENKGNGQTL